MTISLPLLDLPFRLIDRSLFPSTCWITGEPVQPADQGLSGGVRRRLERFLGWPFCPRCGATLGPWSDLSGCRRCPARRLGVERIVRAGPLDEPLSSLVRLLKFHGRWPVAAILASWLGAALERHAAGQVDVLAPVPLHWRRQWRRGFNQAHEIAAYAGGRLNRPVLDVLRRIRPTAPQTRTQSVTARADNLRGAFEAFTHPLLAGKRVWLVDDVCTTGATLRAAAAALRALPAGIRPASICAAVVAVADSTPIPAND